MLMRFTQLDLPGLAHGFTLRRPGVETTPEHAHQRINEAGLPLSMLVQAEQIHGCGVAVVESSHANTIVPHVDALITRHPGIALAIRAADCGTVYFYDPVNRVIALAHSGRKGTALNITSAVIRMMRHLFCTRPQDLVIVLGPCIRPPHYDVDFAADIAVQATACGVTQFHDCGHNTGSDLDRFYSYRMEKGQTGRHYAVLSLC